MTTLLSLNAQLQAENASLRQTLEELTLKVGTQIVVCKQCHTPARLADLLIATMGGGQQITQMHALRRASLQQAQLAAAMSGGSFAGVGGSSGAGLSAQSWLGAGLLGAGNGLPGVAGLAAGLRAGDGGVMGGKFGAGHAINDQKTSLGGLSGLEALSEIQAQANSAQNRASPGDINGLKRPAEGEAGPAGEETVGTQEIPEMKKLRESGPDEQPAEDPILPLGRDV